MILGLTFATPLLLVGLLAAGIPFLLHLLSSVRAQEVYFPTLRFLEMSMEKTARRRRIQHWLLLLLRALLLALLAVAVAEPISEATGGWLSGKNYAAVVVLDNSMSMSAKEAGGTRLSAAKAQASRLLAGDDRPALAAVLLTNAAAPPELTGRLEEIRQRVSQAPATHARAPMAQKVAEAMDLLAAETSVTQKAVYVFSDMQRASFEELLRHEGLDRHKDIHLLVVNTASDAVENVGIRSVEIDGQPVMHETLTFIVTLTNSSPTDREALVGLRVEGRPTGQPVRTTLRAAGQEGASRVVRFRHRFSQAGPVSGEVYIEGADALPADNVRRFSLEIAGRIRALIVRPDQETGLPPALDPAVCLRLALDPFGGDASIPWPVRPTVISAGELRPETLAGADIVFLANIPSLSEVQAAALSQYVRTGGGTAAIFLGPDVDARAYNQRLSDILPAVLRNAVGEVGPDAPAVGLEWVDFRHPYFEGLYANPGDYLTALVQRRFRVEPLAGAETLLRLSGGEALLLTRSPGEGACVLCATTASPRWANLTTNPIFLPMLLRMSLLSRGGPEAGRMHLAGSRVAIQPKLPPSARSGAKVVVTRPGSEDSWTLPLGADGRVVFTETAQPGHYRWRVTGADAEAAGAFAINPSGEETDLQPLPAETLSAGLRRRGLGRVYARESLAAASAAAAADTRGRNWWDYLAVAAILVLVIEAVAANSIRRRGEQPIPARLNPRVAA